jgi:hypothetical protein
VNLKGVTMMKALILGFALAVAGCASTGTTTPAQTVFAAKSAYAGVLTAAVAYESLPRCSETRPQPCSSPALVEQLRKADNTAAAALDAAETAVRTPAVGTDATSKAIQTANLALAALQALVITVGGSK